MADRVTGILLLRYDGAALCSTGTINRACRMLVCGRRRVVAEPGESMLECARRELREETEYDCADLRFLMSFDATVEAEPAQQLTICGLVRRNPARCLP